MSEIQDAVPYGYEEERRIVTPNPGPMQDEVFLAARAADAQHEAMQALLRQNEELKLQLAKAVPDSSETSKKLSAAGGEPVPHHLHLVDGRVIPNYDGISTHYSEVIDGQSVVTRVKSHYPANEPDPASRFV